MLHAESEKKVITAIWNRALETPDLESNVELYKEWAGKYEEDVLGQGYSAPDLAAFELDRALVGQCAGTEKKPEALSILDIGAGTGLVSDRMNKLRQYECLDALDSSQPMLDIAKEKNLYRNYICADGNNKDAVQAGSYDALVSVGTFTPGHMGADGFESCLVFMKIGGLFCFTARSLYFNDPGVGLKERIKKLESEGKIELYSQTPELVYHAGDPHTKYRSFIYQRLK
jgi:predicted TPR repeat methyltransferase